MKNAIKVIVAAAALAATTSTQAYVNNDLIVGFDGGKVGSTPTDFIYDLGKFNTLFVGETWNVGTVFGQNNLGTDFGVVGASLQGSSASHIFVTSSDSAQNGFVQANGQQAAADVATIGTGLTTSGTRSRTTTPSDTTGWTYETENPSGNTSVFQSDYYNPNTAVGSTAFFFNNSNGNSGAAVGLFNYDPTSGLLSFVPEPSTYGVLAGLGLLALMLRRSFARA